MRARVCLSHFCHELLVYHPHMQPIAHLTKRKISHLSNSETVPLADAVAGQFCYTMKRTPALRVGRVLWLRFSIPIG
jgi:hypothetical protein